MNLIGNLISNLIRLLRWKTSSAINSSERKTMALHETGHRDRYSATRRTGALYRNGLGKHTTSFSKGLQWSYLFPRVQTQNGGSTVSTERSDLSKVDYASMGVKIPLRFRLWWSYLATRIRLKLGRCTTRDLFGRLQESSVGETFPRFNRYAIRPSHGNCFCEVRETA